MGTDPRITAFSFRRQRLDGSAATALEAVAAAIGVYAVNPSGPLSIRARARQVTPDEILALDRQHLVLRTRAMRTSAFLVPRETAGLIRAATAVPIERFDWMLRAARVPPDAFASIREGVVVACAAPRTAREIRAGTSLGDVEIGPLLSLLSLRGDLVAVGSGTLTSNATRYLARDAWLGGAADAALPDAVEGRAWLAREYLRAFGPARIGDLAWWAGWSVRVATDALAAVDAVDVGDGLLLAAEDRQAFAAGAPLGDEVTLLPKWDAWTMGYPADGRERFIDHDVHDRIFDGDGNGLAMVLLAGRAIGAWSQRVIGTRLEADIDPFDRWSDRVRRSVEEEVAAIGRFLGLRYVRVRDVDTVIPRRSRIRRPMSQAPD